MKANTLTRQFCQSDPLFRSLNEKRHFEPSSLAWGVAILSGMALSIELLLAVENGMTDKSRSELVFIVSSQAFVIFPLAVILYFAVPDFLARPFSVLEASGAIGESVDPSVESYNGFREKMISSINSLLWIGLALFLIMFYWYYRLFMSVSSDPSEFIPDEYRVGVRLALLLIYSPLLYMGVLTLGRILVGLFYIGRFFQTFDMRVNPMNPDGLGGIGFVGQMLVTSALIATAFGAAAAGLVYVNLGNNPLERVEIIILGLIYLILTPLLFYSLMWSPHVALLRAREKALRPLADEYQRISMQGTQSGKRNIEAIKSKTDHLVEIKRQYELIRDLFPVWSLDTRSLRNLLATSILPAVSTLVPGLITGLWNMISQALRLGRP